MKIQFAVAANRQKMKPRGRVAANDFGERGRAGKKIAESRSNVLRGRDRGRD